MRKIIFTNTLSLLLIFIASNLHASSLKAEFSHERGFYGKSFLLTISSNKSGSVIKYTLDGSDPRFSASAEMSSSPAIINVSPTNITGRAISPGVIVRACAIKGEDTSYVETNTYLFPSEVKYQKPTSDEMAPYWPTTDYVSSKIPPNCVDWMRINYQIIDLETDRSIVLNKSYKEDFESALFDIPTISLVTDPASLFSSDSGIYVNPLWSGKDWERAGSMEIIYPSGKDNIQANTGIRIKGGWSRQGAFPKHGFKLYFRNEYGTAKLKYPLFGDEGTSEFERIDLRCSQNDSWSVRFSNSYATYLNDLFWRDTQRDMKEPYTRSRWYHLYLNGIYWGLYQTEERAEASFAESYFGGKSEDYDVVKSSGPSYDYPQYTLEANDGDLESSRKLWTIAKEGFTDVNYKKALGLNPDGTRNSNYPILLDADNVIDYMITIYFSANGDGPGDLNGSDEPRINNFFGIFNKKDPDGFKYIMHDAESTFGDPNTDITGIATNAGDSFKTFNPMWLHQQLIQNDDYKIRFADKAYKHLYNGGVLTVNENIKRLQVRANEIYMAIVDESARWGDVNGTPMTRNTEWLREVNYYITKYFPARTSVVIRQFKNRGWLGTLSPPALDSADFIFKEKEIKISKGGTFKLTNPNSSGTIYYTLDETDPRVMGGTLSSTALQYSNKIMASGTVKLKARIKDGSTWSPILERTITLNNTLNLKITEINYNPARQIYGNDTLFSKNLEFIELRNSSNDSTDLAGFSFTNGIKFTFPLNSIIPPAGYLVLASDSVSFKKHYGFKPFDQYVGNLSDEGEVLILKQNTDSAIIRFNYSDYEKTIDITDGSGFSLVLGKNCGTQTYNWRASTNLFGSPGADDPENCLSSKGLVKITEVLNNSAFPKSDAIELFNTADTAINIGSWYMSDNKANCNKWKIPLNTIIPAKSYLTIYEGHYEGSVLKFSENEFGSNFSISSAGENIYLFSSDNNQNVQSLICEYKVGATDTNESFGTYLNSGNETRNVLLSANYFNSPNAEAKKSPLIFKEIMYKPISNNNEFIVLKNRTDSILHLYLDSDSSITWKIDGVNFEFPAKTSINAGDSVYIVENKIIPDIFRKMMGLSKDIQIFAFNGHLENNGENISILKPLVIKTDSSIGYAYINLESINYMNKLPWPEKANGQGYALMRKDENTFADDASNWTIASCLFPIADAGSDLKLRVNEKTILDGSASSDPEGKSINYNWRIISKPLGSSCSLSDSTKAKPEMTPDKKGDYTFALTVSNGNKSSAESIVNILVYENTEPKALLYSGTYYTYVNSSVTLDATASYDYYYEKLGYNWEIIGKPQGSNPNLIDSETAYPVFSTDTKGKYTVSMVVNDGVSYSSSVSLWVIATYPTGTENMDINEDIRIYPNPVKSYVNIDLNSIKDSRVSISDISGKVIFTEICKETSTVTINMDELHVEHGMYFINVQSGEFNVTKKVIYVR